jgi:hypothetical protein
LLSHQTLHQYLATQTGLLRHPQPGVAFHVNVPPFVLNAPRFNRHFRVIHAAASQTIRGGQAVNVASVDGTHYRIQLGYISNTVATSAADGLGGTFTQTTQTPASTLIQPQSFPQPEGAVRVYAMPNGQIGIVVDGSTANPELTINPLPSPIRKGYAHSYAYGMAGRTHLINIGQITINSGTIGAIEGFHTANLSGPLDIPSTATVDRIAFNAILPGASITTGGTVNTLDVLQGITLNTGTSIRIGNPSGPIDSTTAPTGDLNLLNVGGNIDLENGSQIAIGRDMGATLQPPKGTGSGSNVLSLNQPVVGTTSSITTPSVSAYIQGSMFIGAGSAFTVGRNVDEEFFVIGNITGASRIVIPHSNVAVPPANSTVFSLGTITA